jgi:glutamate---cysteine ligase / carboxylate-amine ligase
LVDPDTHLVVPKAPEVIAAVAPQHRDYVKAELLSTQLEIATPVCNTLADLRDALMSLRSAVVEAAARVGCRILPAGTGLLDRPSPAAVTENARFSQQAHNLGALVDRPGLCACHVHVAVRDRELAAAVSNHLRPWLPVLQAIGTNSPYADGRDTGYASWRSMLAVRYPTSGPPPWFDSAAHHNRIVGQLITSGAMADERGVYWFARPSPAYPTIEVRVSDVLPTVDETLLVAALVRALVLAAASDVDNGRGAVPIEDRRLVPAHWRAARFGLEGDGTDVFETRTRPAWQLVDDLIYKVTPVLDALGDREMVAEICGRLKQAGSAALRQRAVFAKEGALPAVVDYLIGQMLQSLSGQTHASHCA